MTNNENVLYVKDMGFSDSSFSDDDEEDIWDDSKLNNAYDKALKIANAEVARRVAMSTNTAPTNEDASKPKAKTHHKNPKWKVGMHCRVVYDGDGIEYEAVLLRIINGKECVIRFLGYDNTELVSLSDLIPSLGNAERTRQIQDSVADKVNGSNDMECGDRATSPGSRGNLEPSSQKKRKPSKKRNKQKQTNNFQFPDIPMPNLAEFRNLSPLEMPPPPMLNTPQESEDQALSSMLLSWYMSGYYTGLYKGMKRAQEVGKK